jgi:hypothetical protein
VFTATAGGGGRSSVRWRQSPAPNSTAVKVPSGATPARRASIARPSSSCPPIDAGNVAASFTTTRSPGESDAGSAPMRRLSIAPDAGSITSRRTPSRCSG